MVFSKGLRTASGAATQTSPSLQFYHEGGMPVGPPEPALHGANFAPNGADTCHAQVVMRGTALQRTQGLIFGRSIGEGNGSSHANGRAAARRQQELRQSARAAECRFESS